MLVNLNHKYTDAPYRGETCVVSSRTPPCRACPGAWRPRGSGPAGPGRPPAYTPAPRARTRTDASGYGSAPRKHDPSATNKSSSTNITHT